MLVALWAAVFVLLPLGGALLDGAEMETKGIGMGASLGFVIVVASWVGVLLQISAWVLLARLRPQLDGKLLLMVVFSVCMGLLVLGQDAFKMPQAMLYAASVIAFLLPRLLCARLKPGVFSSIRREE